MSDERSRARNDDEAAPATAASPGAGAPRATKTIFAADLADPRARGAALRVPARTAPQREPSQTSDVTRVRRIGVAAILSASGAAAAFALSPGALGTKAEGPGPLTLPHQKAGLTCEKCHGTAAPGTNEHADHAKAACVGCHGPHPSTREGHKRLAKNGELGCTTCHMAHGPHQGVEFSADGSAKRYGQGGEVPLEGVAFRSNRDLVVPLVPAKACLGCHSRDERDPLAHCIADASAGERALSLCFDEHQDALPADLPAALGPSRPFDRRSDPRSPEPRSPRGSADGAPKLSSKSVCASQHFPDRALAWEAARASAAKVPWVGAPKAASSTLAWLGAGGAAGALGYAGTALAGWLGRRKKKPKPAVVQAAERKRLPVIDTSTCLGCYACVDACPYGVIEVERYVAVVARPDACCGLVLCEQKCPNGSLKMQEGEVVGDRPRVAESLESLDVAGLYLSGDVTGLPLIKNAILQGAHAVDGALAKKRRDGEAEDAFDVCIVGAGPSGISAALRAKERGAEYIVLEQGKVAESIRSFPRGKLIFDQPLDIPVAGKLWLKESTKEELLLHWMRIVRREELPIRERRRMTSITKLADGTFEVRAAIVQPEPGEPAEEVVKARAVVLSIGRRGTPRKLGCAIPEDLESRVYYHLADARSLAGQRIVIVGLGDTAMEAAIALCHESPGETGETPADAGLGGKRVTIVARAATYSRGQTRNIDEVERLRAAGRLDVLWQTEIASVSPGNRGAALAVETRSADGARRRVLDADAIIVLIGSIAPWDTLGRAGVRKISSRSDGGTNDDVEVVDR